MKETDERYTPKWIFDTLNVEFDLDPCSPVGGIIDPNYRGEIGVTLVNMGSEDAVFSVGDRIAQLVVYKVSTAGEVVMAESDKVTETNRGSAGFGSSGK